jgi:DNA-binding NtrC family response regulator
MTPRVLVLTDAVLDASVTRFLQLDGYEVVTAAQVAEAAVVLEERQVHLLLASIEHLGRSIERFIEEAMIRDPMLAVLLVAREATLQTCVAFRTRRSVGVLRMPLALVDVRDGVREALDARDVWSPIARLRRRIEQLSSEEMSEHARELVRNLSLDVEMLASRVRSVTGGR